MENRHLEINVIEAKDLKDVNLLTRMDVYVKLRISKDPRSIQTTLTQKNGHTNPKWNHGIKFNVPDQDLQSNSHTLVFSLISKRVLGDKLIGEVHVPLREFLDEDAQNRNTKGRIVTRGVRTPSGKIEGSLTFSYKFGEKYPVEVPNSVQSPQYWAVPPPGGYNGSPSTGGYYPPAPAVTFPAQGYDGYPAPYAAALPSAGGYYPPPPPEHAAAPYPAQGYNGYPAPYAAALPSAGGYYPPPTPQHGAVPYPPQGYNRYPNHVQPGYGYPTNQNPGYNGGGLLSRFTRIVFDKGCEAMFGEVADGTDFGG